MKIVRNDEGEARQGSTFTNTAYLNRRLSAQTEGGPTFSLVTFEDGAVTFWHEHPGEQILYVVEGEGRVGNENEEFPLAAGDLIHIGPGERHYHGAAPGKSMTHISVTTVGPPIWDDHGPE